MKLFFAFLVLSFMVGLLGRSAEAIGRGRWYLAGLCLALAVGLYAFHLI